MQGAPGWVSRVQQEPAALGGSSTCGCGGSEQRDVQECPEGRLTNNITHVKAWASCWSPWNPASPQHCGHPLAWPGGTRAPLPGEATSPLAPTLGRGAVPDLSWHSPQEECTPSQGITGRWTEESILNFSSQDHDQTS